MINLVVVSDIRLYREGLSKILNDESSIVVVGDAKDVKQTIGVLTSSRPDIVLLDMIMVEKYNVIKAIQNQSYKTKLIVLSMFEDETNVLTCAKAGISGYLPRDSSIDELVEAIIQVHNDEIYCPSCFTKYLLNSLRGFTVKSIANNTKSENSPISDILTRRECQIVKMMADGFSNKQIARNLTIEVSTVKNHVHNVLVKLDAKNRTQVVSKLKHSSII